MILKFKTMAINTKRRSSRFDPPNFHTKYGIQNWLNKKGFIPLQKGSKYQVDDEEYKKLLKEFCLYDNPEFDFTKLKHGLASYESYVDKRFPKFCSFCTNKFKEHVEKSK